MDILYLLIPLAVVLMVVAVVGLMWAIRSGQFEDMEGPAHRILMDDDDPRIPARQRTKAAARPDTSTEKDAERRDDVDPAP